MSDPLEIPEHIRKCAVILEGFFLSRGIEEWALMGIRSRSAPFTDDTGKVLLTKEQHGELLAAVRDLEKTQTELDVKHQQLEQAQSELARLKGELQAWIHANPHALGSEIYFLRKRNESLQLQAQLAECQVARARLSDPVVEPKNQDWT